MESIIEQTSKAMAEYETAKAMGQTWLVFDRRDQLPIYETASESAARSIAKSMGSDWGYCRALKIGGASC
jgi:hypothetical protein